MVKSRDELRSISFFVDFDSFVPFTTLGLVNLEISRFSVDNNDNNDNNDNDRPITLPLVHARGVIKCLSNAHRNTNVWK